MAAQWIGNNPPTVAEWGTIGTGSATTQNYWSGYIDLCGGWVDATTYAIRARFWFANGSYGGTADWNGYFDGTQNITDSPSQRMVSGSPTYAVKYTNYFVDDAATEGKVYSARGYIVNDVGTGSTTVTAQARTTYEITFNANGGTGTQSGVKYFGTDYTIPACDFTRSGYAFDGWNTKADGTGTAYAAGDTYSADEALTLYAQWEPQAIMHYKDGTAKTSTEIYVKVGGAAKQVIGVYRNNDGTAEQTL